MAPPGWPRHGRCSGSKTRCQNTFRELSGYLYARYHTHKCSEWAVRWTGHLSRGGPAFYYPAYWVVLQSTENFLHSLKFAMCLLMFPHPSKVPVGVFSISLIEASPAPVVRNATMLAWQVVRAQHTFLKTNVILFFTLSTMCTALAGNKSYFRCSTQILKPNHLNPRWRQNP